MKYTTRFLYDRIKEKKDISASIPVPSIEKNVMLHDKFFAQDL